ncbi:MAG TPA: AI-2E family transporter [Gaiellaceae bacterium]|nr:AI-2E family transporter [Gaiellaceae bacterium]
MRNVAGPPKLPIPRWIQLVALPLLLLLAWVVATTAYHVVLVFVVAALVALLLDPIVRALQRVHVPRGLSVALVYLSFLAALGVTIGALGTVAVDQTKTAASRVDDYFTKPAGRFRSPADHDVDRFQRWLNAHHLRQVDVQERGHRAVRQIRQKDVGRYTTRVVDFVEGAAISIGKALFELVLLLVVSIYMLLDLPRLAARIDRRFPPRPGSGALIPRLEAALAGYVRGQALLSAIIGGTAGVGLWIFGATGLLPGGDRYALLFGAWVAVTEVIPYVGPWIGAVPPLVYALLVHPVAVLWVALLFLAVHQLEGHVVAPKVMGSALRLNPLLVIFGLLAGGEIYGLVGALLALPLLACGRALWEFFSERFALEPWREAPAPVEVPEPEEEPAEVAPLTRTAGP